MSQQNAWFDLNFSGQDQLMTTIGQLQQLFSLQQERSSFDVQSLLNLNIKLFCFVF